MNIPSQKTIDQYLQEMNVPEDKKEKVLLAVTDRIYHRNQNVIKLENEKDQSKQEQFLRSIQEYDEIIGVKIDEILQGKPTEETYDF